MRCHCCFLANQCDPSWLKEISSPAIFCWILCCVVGISLRFCSEGDSTSLGLVEVADDFIFCCRCCPLPGDDARSRSYVPCERADQSGRLWSIIQCAFHVSAAADSGGSIWRTLIAFYGRWAGIDVTAWAHMWVCVQICFFCLFASLIWIWGSCVSAWHLHIVIHYDILRSVL